MGDIDCDGRWLGGGAVAVAAGIRALGENKVQRDKVWLVSCLHPRGEQVRILPDLLRAPIRKKFGGAKRCFRCCRVEKIRALRSFVQGTEALCCCPGLSIAEGGHRPDATFFGARLAEFSVSLQAGPTSHCPLYTSNQAPNGAFSGHHHHEHGSRPNNQHGSEILTDAVLSQTKPPGQG